MAKVKLDDWGDGDEVLLCPKCGFDYLHQQAIRLYSRADDAKTASVRVCQITGRIEAAVADDNPSDRRQGLVIEFDCEGCGGIVELAVFQHKGQTLVRWQN